MYLQQKLNSRQRQHGSTTRNVQDLPQNGTRSPPDFDAASVAPYQSPDGHHHLLQQQLYVFFSSTGPTPATAATSTTEPGSFAVRSVPPEVVHIKFFITAPTSGNPPFLPPSHAAAIRQGVPRVPPSATVGTFQQGQQTIPALQPSPPPLPTDAASAGTPGRLGTANPSSPGASSGRRYGTTSTCAVVIQRRRIISN